MVDPSTLLVHYTQIADPAPEPNNIDVPVEIAAPKFGWLLPIGHRILLRRVKPRSIGFRQKPRDLSPDFLCAAQ